MFLYNALTVVRYIRDRVSLRTWKTVGKVHQGQSASEDSEKCCWRVVVRYGGSGVVQCQNYVYHGNEWCKIVKMEGTYCGFLFG